MEESPLTDVYSFLRNRSTSLARHLRSKGLDLPDSASLRSCVRALDSGPTLALDAHEAPAPEVDTQKLTATFVISTLGKDRMGDVVIPRGCLRLLPKNYFKNPRVFFSHKSGSMPIGSARHPDGSLAVEVQDSLIRSTCYFNEETEESRLTWRMVARKELQAASIGFLPIKAAVLRPEKEPERPETDPEGDDLIYFDDGSGWFPSLKFHEWDLTEWSIVPVPANADCISQHLSRGSIDGEKLTASFRKSLEPFALPEKTWSNGAGEFVLAETPSDAGENVVKEEAKIATPEPVTLDTNPPGVPVPKPVLLEEATQDDLDLISQGFICYVHNGFVTFKKPEDYLKDMGEDLRPPESSPVVQPEPDPKEKMPHGAKMLYCALQGMDQHCSMIEADEPMLDHPKVKAHMERHKARVKKLRHKMAVKASEVYPEHFADPGDEPEEAKSLSSKKQEKALEDLFQEELTAQLLAQKENEEWLAVQQELLQLQSQQSQQAESWFEVTGRRV